MDVGFSQAGVDIVFANDLDKDACSSYRANHGDVICDGSIVDHFDRLKGLVGADLVFGGPPCQGFSVAGKMNPEDERSKLIRTFFDVVDLVKPTAFVCENVKALATLSRWATVREELMSRARPNYITALVVLNSHDFGVPQNRERMFLVGLSKKQTKLNELEFGSALKRLLNSYRCESPSVQDLILSLGRGGTRRNERVCKAKITFARNPVLRKSPYAGMLFNGAGRPLAPLGRAPTLPASMGGNKTPIVDEGVIFSDSESFVERYHAYLMNGGKPYEGEAPAQLRRLTVDECLAIQTFPKGYELKGSQSSMYKQIGNAVPARLAKAVALSLLEIIRSEKVNRTTPMRPQKMLATG